MKKIIFLLICCASGIISGQTPLNYLSSTQGGSAYEICYNNNYLYAGCGSTLRVYDLTGPNQTPGALKFEYRFTSTIDYLTVRNNFLYVCANHAGLSKWDLSSDPASPALVCSYTPASLGESIYDIAFYGDSIFVAAKTKVNILLDSANTFTYKGTLQSYNTTTRVRGLDIKDSLLAYTVGLSGNNAIDGVYLYNIKNLQQLAFYNQTKGDPLEVYFGENTQLLHVMGGNITLTPNGIYYALDYTDSSLTVNYSDTIKGYLLLGSLASPMNAKIIHDTIYVSTQGGGPINYTFPNPFSGQVYVYDATNAGNITRLTDIYAGLYHFDTDINPLTRKMYVASEWYGILTMDITDIYNELSLGKTLTGGWCHGSAKAKDKFVEAAEGFGVRLFDFSVPQSPSLIAVDTTVGFCRAISISDSANYVYGWFLTGKRLRVLSGNNLSLLADTTVDPGTFSISDFEKSRRLGNKIAVIENIGPNNKKIVLADVSNPAIPYIKKYKQMNDVSDLLFHPSGKLFACRRDSILVLDTSALASLSFVTLPLPGSQHYQAFALYNDTLYAYYSGLGHGIAKYYYNSSAQTLTYITAGSLLMLSSGRIFMAADADAVYISSTIDSLKAISKSSLQRIKSYNHGADFIYDNLWGVMDLYSADGYLILNEYMAQSTIFNPSITTAINSVTVEQPEGLLYPNPATNSFCIPADIKDEKFVRIFDADGRLVYEDDFNPNEKIQISTTGFNPGIYIVSVMTNAGEKKVKLIVQK